MDESAYDLDGLDFGKVELEPKKKKNSKAKGNRVELKLCKLLHTHFGQPFERSVGSGNRWAQVRVLTQAAKEVFIGDICAPEGFRWVIECKGGYEDKIDLNNLGQPIAQLDTFIKQSMDDAVRAGRLPIIVWKRSRKPWVAMIKKTDLHDPEVAVRYDEEFRYRTYYDGWVILPLEPLLLMTPDEFWFERKSNPQPNGHKHAQYNSPVDVLRSAETEDSRQGVRVPLLPHDPLADVG